jgi:hypothetical protein
MTMVGCRDKVLVHLEQHVLDKNSIPTSVIVIVIVIVSVIVIYHSNLFHVILTAFRL